MHDEREWYEGRLCLWAAGPRELQEALISGGPERFFVPPYVGHRGWVGLRLDLPDVDWDEVMPASSRTPTPTSSRTADRYPSTVA